MLIFRLALVVTSTTVLLGWAAAVWFSSEPEIIDIKEHVTKSAPAGKPVIGYATTDTLIFVTETLLDKPGGFIANDLMPPFSLMDNMPAWELGALEMVRDLSLAMRRDFSRSQSQSMENELLKQVQPKFNIDYRSWAVPQPESEYTEALKLLKVYRKGLSDPNSNDHQFYARADNLREWLLAVEKRLGSYSQRLSASVGQDRLNTDLAGDISARQSTLSPDAYMMKTSWLDIDDEFYEARGAAWALLHFLKAVEIDFADVLERKNATVSLQQIIRELESTQQTVWSPMVLNGSGFGLMANHSLVMANYISRANAALIDLSDLLSKG
jgi:hypothetical protein